ncbi:MULTISPECIES: serine/threonine-protein kinase [unclassified Streptomyces]|uniref:serine/threonine-protein kinase n=1 Tax=unclassified Streptomyces TaxID=2593676 RepID=UPI001F0494B8|nr:MULTISPECIES: serine/threonine-protein kinase [unclassified Streptomyces]MCH0564816.1 serine/threonine protein kinase [Streptomyces sp. MUM 2J]MCH0569902.1 serine/threonine protein kinase [Streptomyces sp. MUM 136J]
MRPGQFELPGYDVQEVLGQGGFATVYRARQLMVDREVALKVDSRRLSTQRDRQRFMREVTSAGRLSGHPHVVAVYDAGVLDDNRPYIVLELCPGGSLGERLLRDGPLPVKEARDIGVGIADAVAAAHAAGVLHRDIKPGNIMVNQYGAVALTDFGLAAMPRPDQELSVTRDALTPAYAPPEAFRMAEPSTAGDVYSLAATVYALLLGRPPHFPADGRQLGLAELIVRHSWPYPALPAVPAALNEVLRQALSADPVHRLPHAGALRDGLAAVDLDTVDLGRFGPAPGMTTTGGPAHRGYRDIPAPPHTPTQDTTPLPESLGNPLLAGTAPGHPGEAPGTRETPTGTVDRERKRWRPRLIAVLAAVAVSVTVSITVVVSQTGQTGQTGRGAGSTSNAAPSSPGTAGGSSSPSSPGFGVPTTTENCPATDVEGVGGRCVTSPECWSGILDVSGIVTVSRADCHVKHVWETFAIASLPADGMTNNARDLIKHPDVRALCSQQVMAGSRSPHGADIAADWQITVIPPSAAQWDDGLRVFRCVAAAGTEDGQVTGSYFGTRG